MLAPVILFVYNRPLHTKKVIEALSKNYLAKKTNVYIFSDSYRDEKDYLKVIETREYIKNTSNLHSFKNVEIFEAKENKGLANSVIDGVNKIINQYGKVIVLEDDLVTSVDFLEYMNEALDYYEKDERIWSISGYNLPIAIPSDYKKDIYLSYRANSWGWATWKDRWIKTDWEVTNYADFKNNHIKRNSFNKGGRDLSAMLDEQMKGNKDSWAIRWCFSQWENGMYTVYPVASKVKNIGLDGSGTHSNKTSRYDVELEQIPKKIDFSNLTIDKRIIKNFQSYYINRNRYIVNSIKRKLLKLIK